MFPKILARMSCCLVNLFAFVLGWFFLTGEMAHAAYGPSLAQGPQESSKNVRTEANGLEGPFFGNGIKIGETSSESAIIWVRLTKNKQADFSRLKIFSEGLPKGKRDKTAMPTGIHPGSEGSVLLSLWRKGQKNSPFEGVLVGKVDPKADFTLQISLKGLQPSTDYEFQLESCREKGSPISDKIVGTFRTAGGAKSEKPVRFMVSTCQAVRSIDSGKDGHIAYKQMADRNPDFFVHTGDILYYDKTPLCKNFKQANAKWNLMFSYGHNQKFLANTTSYFMKDDHDTLKNDCWPGQKYGDLTFDQGLQIFRNQVAMGKKTYRTIRWSKDVQIWLTENRDFRSKNTIPDGPNKTILGKEQYEWLTSTIKKSDAKFKFVISPGPIVGPDKKKKADNHSNPTFFTEGQKLRDFLSGQNNTFVICGDRHWQYCSKDPKTGLLEFGCGPINDEHDFGGNPGHIPEYHQFFGKTGGFLEVEVKDSEATVRWFSASQMDEHGKPKEVFKKVLK